VVDFFSAFGSAVEVFDFTVLTIAGNDEDVHAVVRFAGKGIHTGRTLATHLHHWFRFTGDKVSYYRGSEDTALTAATLA
jgi:ketosteroid isomerase-like protein